MCLAVPAQVKEVLEHYAIVELMGTKIKINSDLLEESIELGDYVLVHAGYALKKLEKGYALETIALFEEAAIKFEQYT